MPVIIQPEELIFRSSILPFFDVRSPSEFEVGHVPGAFNLPLFSDEERAVVGTLYKQTGKDEAILKGLDYVGPKMTSLIKQGKKIAPGKEIMLYCWRGGFRSKSMAWLFETAGFKVYLLEGGYKAYRRYIRSKFDDDYKLLVLGGKTGSGKTYILKAIAEKGEQFLDIEGIANHKGSAFGDIGENTQPTNEQFENNLFHVWKDFNTEKQIWVEDESRGLGTVSIPEPLYDKIRSSNVIFIEKEKELRVNQLVADYGLSDKELLGAAIVRIKKRLGGLNVKLSIEALENNDLETVASILLQYYDKAYLKGLSFRNEKSISIIALHENDPEGNAEKIIEFSKGK